MIPFPIMNVYGNAVLSKLKGISNKLSSTIPKGSSWCSAYDNNDTIYLYGGSTNGGNSGVINSLYSFKISTKVVTLIETNFSTTPVSKCGFCFYNNKLYIFGGSSSGGYSFCYDITSKVKTQLPTLPTEGSTCALLYNNNFIIIAANVLYEYDIVAATYTKRSDLPVNTTPPISAAIIDNTLYFLKYTQSNSTVDVYITNLNTFGDSQKILTTDLPYMQYNYPILINIMNDLYIFSSGYIFKYENSKFKQINNSSGSNLILPGACAVKNTFYLFGGYRESSRLDEIWLVT